MGTEDTTAAMHNMCQKFSNTHRELGGSSHSEYRHSQQNLGLAVGRNPGIDEEGAQDT